MNAIPSVVHSDPDILGGIPVFVGTRVPVRTLLDYLAAGDTLETFLDHFPGTERMEELRRRVSEATGCEATRASVRRALQEARRKISDLVQTATPL